MRFTASICMALVPLLSMSVRADGDVEAGKRHFAACAACHGAAAEGNPALQAPRLNHLRPVYILAQLQSFRGGLRGGDPGTATAFRELISLSEEQEALVQHQAALIVERIKPTARDASA